MWLWLGRNGSPLIWAQAVLLPEIQEVVLGWSFSSTCVCTWVWNSQWLYQISKLKGRVELNPAGHPDLSNPVKMVCCLV